MPRVMATEMLAAADTSRMIGELFLDPSQLSQDTRLMYLALLQAAEHFEFLKWHPYPDVKPPHLTLVDVTIKGENLTMVYDAKADKWFTVMGAIQPHSDEGIIAWRYRLNDVFDGRKENL